MILQSLKATISNCHMTLGSCISAEWFVLGYRVSRNRTFNLFVTSKNETTNSPIHKFKLLHKARGSFKRSCISAEWFALGYIVSRSRTFNLFVTSKNETTNSPIHELKLLHKDQREI